MQKFINIFMSVFIATTMLTACRNTADMPPKAEIQAHELKNHGKIRVDNFYWLKDSKNKKVLEYLEAENTFTENYMSSLEGLKDSVFTEITNRIKPREESVPYKSNGYFYYLRYENGKELPIHCRKKDSLQAQEEIIIDENRAAEGLPYFELSEYSVSEDNRMLAYAVDTTGEKQYTVRIFNFDSGKLLQDVIENTSDAPLWSEDGKTLYYVQQDSITQRDYRVVAHRLGEQNEKDQIIYEEEYDEFSLTLSKSKSGKYIFINSIGNTDNEIRYFKTDDQTPKPSLLIKRKQGVFCEIDELDNKLYVLTNDKAKNYQLQMMPAFPGSATQYRDIEKQDETKFIEDFELFKNFAVLSIRENGLTMLKVINLTDFTSYFIEFSDDVYDVRIGENYDPESDILRYTYSSPVTPYSVIDFDLKKQKKYFIKQQEILGNFDGNNYDTERVLATSPDGKKIPISLVYKKGLKKDRQNPLLIHGYGAYGENLDLSFNTSDLCLLDRGFVVAYAHVRGGKELGQDWYDGGRLFNKKNTFSDFIACTEFLQAQGYSKPALTFASGASAGGLLTAASANMRPDLYAAIVAEVPFVDVLTTMLDKNNPLTTEEYGEWGNPTKKDDFEYILSYSPYDQVKNQAYPAIFATAGFYDTQVSYREAAKWIAKLRMMNTSENPLLLYTNMTSGHDGASGRYESYRETSMIYAFLIDIARKNTDK